ncbi:MAG: hypothetical protein D6722_25020, partial [Bacteroidetes bacterium]
MENVEAQSPEAAHEEGGGVPSAATGNNLAIQQALAAAKAEVAGKTAPPSKPTIEALGEVGDPVLEGEGNHQGLSWQQTLAELPEPAKKLLANMRADYTRKTQALAEERRKYEQALTQAQAQTEGLLSSDFMKSLREAPSGDDQAPPTVDPFDPSSIQKAIDWHVNQRVKAQMQELLSPVEKAQELYKNQQAVLRFKAENPDIDRNSPHFDKELTIAVAKKLKETPGLRLADAYWIVKGQRLQARQAEADAEMQRYRDEAKRAGLKIGGARRAGAEPEVPD